MGAFRPHLGNRLVGEGLQKIRSQFLSVDHVGSKSVADFLEITEPEERAITQRQAYERITAWLDALEVAPWREGQRPEPGGPEEGERQGRK